MITGLKRNKIDTAMFKKNLIVVSSESYYTYRHYIFITIRHNTTYSPEL